MVPTRMSSIWHRAFWMVVCTTVIAGLIGCGRSFDNGGEVSMPETLAINGQVLLPSGVAGTQVAANQEPGAKAAGGQPVSGASVWIEELIDLPAQTTDASGTFRFLGLPPGQYHVVTRYAIASRTFMARTPPVSPRIPTTVASTTDLQLETARRVVTGILRDNAGSPLPAGTVLTLWGERIVVGAGGSFTTPPMPDSLEIAEIIVQQVGVTADSRPRVTVPFTSSDAPTTVDVRATPPDQPVKPIGAALLATRNGQALSAANKVGPGDRLALSVTLLNVTPNEAGVQFEWDAGRGQFATAPGNSATAEWIAPATVGLATISVRVSAPDRGFCVVFLPVAIGTTPTPTGTGTSGATDTATGTGTGNWTGTGTGMGTSNATDTQTSTGTATTTGSATATATGTTTATATSTGLATATTTSTGTTSGTGTATATTTSTGSGTGTASDTATATGTATSSGTATSISTSTGTGTNPSFSVVFDPRGGTAVASQTIASGSLVTEPAAPTRTGHTFAGWYREAACTTPWNFALEKVTSVLTLYAKWVINAQTVSFNVQGGSVVATQTVEYNATATAPTPPTRANHVFDGWFRESACTTAFVFATDVVTADITLYAKWTLVKYTVTYVAGANGSLTGSTTQVIEHDTNGTAVTAVPTAGYRFVTWSDARTDNPRTDTNVTANATCTATFAAISASVAAGSKYAWSENAGWLNFGDSNGSATAVLGAGGSLSGYAWGENIGWIKLAGTTGSGAQYGVSISATGQLSGFAWSETTGWLNFGATGGNATVNPATGILSGFAWSESVGWIKLAGTAGSGAAYGVGLNMP